MRVLRTAVLIVMALVTLSLVVAIGTPETGPIEKVVLAVGVLGLIFAAAPVRRIGTTH